MIRRPPRSTPKPSSAASDVYKRQIYVRPEVAEKVIAISKSFNIDAQIVGHIEEGKRSLTIKSEFGTFEY